MNKQTKSPISYAASGVNYDALDLLKRLAQQKAQATSTHLEQAGMQELSASRGESAYVWQDGETYWASVIEGLGTKDLVADATRKITGKTYYDVVAQDTVAMIINDLIVVGAKPLVISAYFAVGSSEWFLDDQRTTDLVNGWAHACELAQVTWGGGETPALKGIIESQQIDLAGSAIGRIGGKERLVLGDRLEEGDVIILVESSGIHANGISLARAIAERLPEGYATLLDDGTGYGEAILQPTHIYVQMVEALFAAGIDIHYMVNITGHGWRKLMRATKEFRYVLEQIPQPQPIFDFIQKHSGSDDQEMYGNFNMGAGFAVYLPKEMAEKGLGIIKETGLNCWLAGHLEAGPKEIIIKPKNISFAGKSLTVRAAPTTEVISGSQE